MFKLFLSFLCSVASLTTQHKLDFRKACVNGDFDSVCKLTVKCAFAREDLNQGLRLSASFARINIMRWLLDNGADDTNEALVHAASQNQMFACRFLLSDDRHPNCATSIDQAIRVAGKMGCTDAEWMLLMHKVQEGRKE